MVRVLVLAAIVVAVIIGFALPGPPKAQETAKVSSSIPTIAIN